VKRHHASAAASVEFFAELNLLRGLPMVNTG